MQTECADCDRPATGFWGRYAYCPRCLAAARTEDPEGHRCPECRKLQPARVALLPGQPCVLCQIKAKEAQAR